MSSERVLVDAEALAYVVERHWRFVESAGVTICASCFTPDGKHAPDCPVPPLQAALDAPEIEVWSTPIPAPTDTEAQELHRALMDVACVDTTEYDNRVADVVADRLLETIATGEPFSSFGGEKLNTLVYLIVSLKRQVAALDAPAEIGSPVSPST